MKRNIDLDFMERSANNRTLLGIIIFVSLLILQVLLGKAGHLAANITPYQQIDPYGSFAGLSIHHIIQMLMTLIVILMLSRRLSRSL